MKIKINDQIPDIEIYQLVNGEPHKSKLKDTLGKEKINVINEDNINGK